MALSWGECLQGLADGLGAGGGVSLGGEVGAVGEVKQGKIGHGDCLVLAAGLGRAVGGNDDLTGEAVGPVFEREGAVKRVEVAPDFEEGFLQEVLGGFEGDVGAAEDEVEEGLLVALNEGAEGGCVAQGGGDELVVGGFGARRRGRHIKNVENLA